MTCFAAAIVQGVLPTAFTSVADEDGVAVFEPVVIQGEDNACFRLRIVFMPCGPTGQDCPAARNAGIDVAQTAVTSSLGSQKYCISGQQEGG